MTLKNVLDLDIDHADIKLLEEQNYEPTGRLMEAHESHLTEWVASISTRTCGDESVTVEAYYYTTAKDALLVDEAGGDWGVIDFKIAKYNVIF